MQWEPGQVQVDCHEVAWGVGVGVGVGWGGGAALKNE